MLNWLWPWSETSASSDTSSSPETQYLAPQTQPPPLNVQQTHPDSHLDALSTQAQRPAPQFPNNKKLLLGGAGFFALSLLLTRRAMRRRYVSAMPAYYTSATYHKPRVNAAIDALEGFYLATLNVASFSMFASGAVLWKFGINSMEDLRSMTRGAGSAVSAKGKSDDELEEEIQEWLARTFVGRYKDEVDRVVERRVKEREEAEGKS